jgi:hypothetical protein
MATYIGIENNPIVVNLLTQANDTGWNLPGDGTAVHVTCNSGYANLLNYPVFAGHIYSITYTILSISSGNVQAFVGGQGGGVYTSPDIIVETITASADGIIRLFSNANCTVQLFNVKDVTLDDAVTVIYSALNKNWSDSRTLYPDFGLSIYERTILSQNGNIYFQQNGSDDRNNFFGTAYQSSIKFVDAKNPDIINGFESLNYQANMLLVTTPDGVTTSLGQVSTLIDTDFIKEKLQSAGLEVINYQKDNVYSASFLPDSNEDTVNGSGLRGNYCIVELITVDGSTPLKLFSVEVKTAHIPIGAR